MKCESPIQLNSGLVVPCGKCILCLSHRRDDWSVRLQLHTMSYDSMPFFVTLTYAPEQRVYGVDRPSICRDHLRSFIKRIKDKFSLYSSDFAYFGCNEYGDKFGAPHAHLILFGFPQLEDAYKTGAWTADSLLQKFWHDANGKTLGFVYTGRADWSGIHYVTKYVLKFDGHDNYDGVEKPSIVYTRGLGNRWLNSPECVYLRSRIQKFISEARFRSPEYVLDFSTPESLRDSARDELISLKEYMPKLVCTLPSGDKVALPRYYRKKLIGSFEHFMDNPFWLYDFYSKLYEATNYLVEHGDYDRESDQSYYSQIVEFAKKRIYQRLLIKQSQK